MEAEKNSFEDSFEKSELIERITLFIFLRWIAICGLAVICLTAKFLGRLPFEIMPVLVVIFICAGYNFAFDYFKKKESGYKEKHNLRQLAVFQISYDALFFILIIHFTGGIESPFLVYFVFHAIASCIILPTNVIYMQVTTTALLMGAVVLLEKYRLLPHVSLLGHNQLKPFESINYILISLSIFIGTIYLSVYLLAYLSKSLHKKQKEVLLKTLDLFTAQADLEDSYLDSVLALVRAIEAKDTYTQGHSERVTKYALMVGEKMGFNAKEMKLLEFAGLLHDIGKIGIKESVLMKVEPLTKEEFAEITEHPRIGYRIIELVKFLGEIRAAVLHHHERFNGNGYPDHLAGEQIPLWARIIAVADAFDAMQSERPYRGAFSMEKAVEELLSGKGTQFDPKVVDIFLKVLKEA